MATKEHTPFGSLLLRHRAAVHLTQEQLAARAGLSPDAITALECGKRRTPRAATVELLASALGLDDDQRAAFLAAAQASLVTPVADPAPLPDEFQSAVAMHLPSLPPTPLIDRTSELNMIMRFMGDDAVRLLTLTGPSGVGKTRLALAAVACFTKDRERFPDGVMFISLASVHDPALVFTAMASHLGVLDLDGAEPSIQARLVHALEQRRQLIVLDNFEQILPAAASLGDLLSTCPGLSLLVTSCVPLHLRWEQILRVAPLPVPDLSRPLPSLDQLATIPSVALFLQRACAHQADFIFSEQQASLVAQLVTQLDGLPLAIELAAARLDVLPLSSIVQRLHDRLHLLKWNAPDLPERHRSLEATMQWGYELLSAEEQRWFRHLGVFTGRVTLEALAAVVSPRDEVSTPDEIHAVQMLTSLAEKSIIQRRRESEDEPGQLAFGMLETVREFAGEQLARLGEREAAQRVHAEYFLALAEEAVWRLHTEAHRQWNLRLEREQANLLIALRWLLEQSDPIDLMAALRLTVALGMYWYQRGYVCDGAHLFEEALRRAAEQPLAPVLRIEVLNLTGLIFRQQGKLDQAQVVLDEALALARQQQDQPGIAAALYELGECAALAGDGNAGVHLLREALDQWRALGDPFLINLALLTLGGAALFQGNDHEALTSFSEALVGYRAIGDSYFASLAEYGMAAAFQAHGDLPQAVARVQEGLRLSSTGADRGGLRVGVEATIWLLHSVLSSGDLQLAVRLLGARDTLSRTTDPLTSVWVPGLSQHLKALREQSELKGLRAAYREGCSLSPEEIVDLVEQILSDLAERVVLDETKALTTKEMALEGHAPTHLLSERERQVLQYVAQGFTNKAVAEKLIISPNTVRYHLTMLFNKLGVDARAQAVAVAAERGLL